LSDQSDQSGYRGNLKNFSAVAHVAVLNSSSVQPRMRAASSAVSFTNAGSQRRTRLARCGSGTR
jgi:hypothetical protein